VGVVTYPTLEHVAMEARPYPAHVLEGCETGLVLFAAAFLGHNDAIHFAEAGIRTTCIDTDEVRLREMKALYPDTWTFLPVDAWTFAEAARDMDTMWDVVSLDPFTGDTMQRVLDDLQLWADLARKALIVGSTTLAVEYPKGFRPSAPTVRASSVYWLVLTRG
jgi:hypothetical protein